MTRQADIARREREVGNACGLGLGHGSGEGDSDVGISDDEVHPGLHQEPHLIRMDLRIEVEVGGRRHDASDLRIGERLEDGLHVTHTAPDVDRVTTTVGITHHHLAAGAGVALCVAPTFHRLVDHLLIEVLVGPGDGSEDDVPAVFVGRIHWPEGLFDERRIGRGGILSELGERSTRNRRGRSGGGRGGCCRRRGGPRRGRGRGVVVATRHGDHGQYGHEADHPCQSVHFLLLVGCLSQSDVRT